MLILEHGSSPHKVSDFVVYVLSFLVVGLLVLGVVKQLILSASRLDLLELSLFSLQQIFYVLVVFVQFSYLFLGL